MTWKPQSGEGYGALGVIAVDTNVVVRLLARDDEMQYQASRTLFETQEIFIPDTVVLELEWCGTPTIFLRVQDGKPWLDVFLRGSNPADRVRDWRGNKAAYLFPPHPTLLPEYFPCSVDCAPTARLARAYEAVLQEYGLRDLLDIIREGLMRPLLLFGGSLYRFRVLKSRGGWYHPVGSTEQYRIDDQVVQRQPEIGKDHVNQCRPRGTDPVHHNR